MKSFENKLTAIEMQSGKGEEPPKAEYGDLIAILIAAPKQGGFDYSDMENRIAIKRSVDESKRKTGEPEKVIEIEDAPFKYLADLVKNAKWQFWHADLIQLKEDILAVK